MGRCGHCFNFPRELRTKSSGPPPRTVLYLTPTSERRPGTVRNQQETVRRKWQLLHRICEYDRVVNKSIVLAWRALFHVQNYVILPEVVIQRASGNRYSQACTGAETQLPQPASAILQRLPVEACATQTATWKLVPVPAAQALLRKLQLQLPGRSCLRWTPACSTYAKPQGCHTLHLAEDSQTFACETCCTELTYMSEN